MGSLRFRRSVSLGKGVRLNVNKRSTGMSFGTRGMRYSVNTSGRGIRSAGIPGTGLYYVDRSRGSNRAGEPGGGRSGSASTSTPGSTALTTANVEQLIPKAGFFASETEKRFREGLVAYLKQDWSTAASAFAQASAADSRNLSDDFFLGATLVRLKRPADAIPSFEKIVASPNGLPDRLMQKFVPGSLYLQVPITERVSVPAGFDSIGATLILAELYQQLGRKSEAIGLIQKLHQVLPNNPAVRLSLADLLYDDDDFAGLVELTEGVENTDDLTLAMLHLKAKALANQGLIGPAAEVLTQCLRRKAGRDPELLKEIRYNRAEAYELLGDKRKAKADWTKLVAEDPLYRDVCLRLENATERQ
jgi:tetratricopeptide (TPR) repeat protein